MVLGTYLGTFQTKKFLDRFYGNNIMDVTKYIEKWHYMVNKPEMGGVSYF